MLTPEQVKKGFETLCEALGADYVLDIKSTGVPPITRKVGKYEIHIQRELIGTWGNNYAIRIRHSSSWELHKNIPEYNHGQKDINKIDFQFVKAKADLMAAMLQRAEETEITNAALRKDRKIRTEEDFQGLGIEHLPNYGSDIFPQFDLTSLLRITTVEQGYCVNVRIPAAGIFSAEEVKKLLAFLQEFIGEVK